jgi:DNA modification methylase
VASEPADLPNRTSAPSRRAVKPAFNGLTPREWTLLSRNVWNDLSSPRDRRHLMHGAVFPVKLVDRLIRLYSREGDIVFDPFVGVGSTLVAAQLARRHSIGIELNPAFVAAAKDWLEDIAPGDTDYVPTLIEGDARRLADHLGDQSVQLTVTSPPYADFIRRSVRDRARTHKKSRFVYENNSRAKVYSDDPNDLGNLEYKPFLAECKTILAQLLAKTRRDGYAVWVVKDYRLPPARPYVPFHSDLAQVAADTGWLWHDLITWDQNEQRSLVLLGYPTRFYTNQNSTFLVVLRRA